MGYGAFARDAYRVVALVASHFALSTKSSGVANTYASTTLDARIYNWAVTSSKGRVGASAVRPNVLFVFEVVAGVGDNEACA